MERERSLLRTKKLSRYSLLFYILRFCRKPRSLAEIYWSRPNAFTYRILKELTAIATSLNLLRVEDRKFVTTEKGKEYIKKFRELLTLLAA
jgi:predicted transcriptional regulator